MDTPILRLYLVRHGVTEWNRNLRMQGHTDVPLDAEGRWQAERIAQRLKTDFPPLNAVWASDLRRAQVTAEQIASAQGLPVQITPLLRETCLGEWEGLSRTEIEARGEAELLQRYRLEPHRFRPPGGETLEAAWERMLTALEQIREQVPSGHVAVAGHGGSLRVLLCHAMETGIASLRRLWLDNASLSLIEWYGHGLDAPRRVLLVNDTSHLSART